MQETCLVGQILWAIPLRSVMSESSVCKNRMESRNLGAHFLGCTVSQAVDLMNIKLAQWKLNHLPCRWSAIGYFTFGGRYVNSEWTRAYGTWHQSYVLAYVSYAGGILEFIENGMVIKLRQITVKKKVKGNHCLVHRSCSSVLIVKLQKAVPGVCHSLAKVIDKWHYSEE